MPSLTSEPTHKRGDDRWNQIATWWESNPALDSNLQRLALANLINSKFFAALDLSIDATLFGTRFPSQKGLEQYLRPLKHSPEKLVKLNKLIENSSFIEWITKLLNANSLQRAFIFHQLAEMTSARNQTTRIDQSLKSWPSNECAMQFLFRFLLDLIGGGCKKIYNKYPDLCDHISKIIRANIKSEPPTVRITSSRPPTGTDDSDLSCGSRYSYPHHGPQLAYQDSFKIVCETQVHPEYFSDKMPAITLVDAANIITLARKKVKTYHPIFFCLPTPATRKKVREITNAISELEQATNLRQERQGSDAPTDEAYSIAIQNLVTALNQQRFFTKCTTGNKLLEKSKSVKRSGSANSC